MINNDIVIAANSMAPNTDDVIRLTDWASQVRTFHGKS